MSAPAPRGAAPVPPHARTSSRRTAWPLAIAAGLALAGASGDALGDDTLEEWTAEAAAAVGPEDRTPILMVDADGFAGASVRALALSDDGRFLAAADDAVVRIYDLRTNQPHRTIRGYREATGSNVGRVNTLAFAPGGDYLALGVTDNSPLGSTRLIDVRDGSVRLVEGHTGCTLTVRFSPDGRHFATSGCDGHAYLYRWQQRGSWNAEGGRVTQLLDLTSESGGTRGADFAGVGWEPRFSADGQFLIDPSTSKGVWAVTPRRLVKDVNELPDGLADLLRTPPTRSAPGYEATITETPCYAGALPVRRSQFAAPFVAQAWQRDEAPDSERYRLMIWDARGGRPKHELPMTYLAAAATLNAAANLAAAADARGTIRVWELTDGKVEGTQIARFDPAGRPLWNVTWSPDGTALRVAADHYERGRFHYNRFGGVTHEFDLRALLFRPSAAAAPDRPITAALPAGRVTTRQREGVSYNPGYGLALLAPRPGGGTNSVWLDPWQDEDREATVTNLNLALPEQYGRPMCYAAAAYPGSTGTHLFFGTDTGRLYEGRLVYDRTNRPLFRPVRRFLGHDGTVTALAISPDRRRLASSSLDGTVRVWGLTPPRELGDLDAATRGTEVTNVPLASLAYKAGLREDDRLVRFGETSFYGRFGSLVAGERRAGDVVEVGLRDGRVGPVTLAPAPDYAFPLWSVYLTRPAAGGSSDATAGDWVAWTADGHYAASEGGAKRVGWHVNDGRAKPARFYTVDQFGDRLHDRRVILAALRNEAPAAAGLPADGPAAPGRVDADDYDAFRKVLPPTISGLAVTPIPSDGPGAAEVTFAVRRPYNAALTAVQVWVDGRLTPGRPAEVGAGREDGAPQTRYRHVVDVPADARLVRVTVEDRRGLRDGADLLLRADDDAADAGEWVTVAAHEEPADPAGGAVVRRGGRGRCGRRGPLVRAEPAPVGDRGERLRGRPVRPPVRGPGRRPVRGVLGGAAGRLLRPGRVRDAGRRAGHAGRHRTRAERPDAAGRRGRPGDRVPVRARRGGRPGHLALRHRGVRPGPSRYDRPAGGPVRVFLPPRAGRPAAGDLRHLPRRPVRRRSAGSHGTDGPGRAGRPGAAGPAVGRRGAGDHRLLPAGGEQLRARRLGRRARGLHRRGAGVPPRRRRPRRQRQRLAEPVRDADPRLGAGSASSPPTASTPASPSPPTSAIPACCPSPPDDRPADQPAAPDDRPAALGRLNPAAGDRMLGNPPPAADEHQVSP